jgi:hypothetical protein
MRRHLKVRPKNSARRFSRAVDVAHPDAIPLVYMYLKI